MKFFRSILVLSFLFFSVTVYAESVSFITDGVQKKYKSIKTLKADFIQTALSMGSGVGRVSSGEVTIKKPGRMKWEFKKPAGDIVVSNGKVMWIYQKDLNQVIETDIEVNTPQVAMNFLAGAGNMEKDFKIEILRTTDSEYELKLSPKEAIPHIGEITLIVDRKTFIVKKTTVKDAFGGQTSVEIKNVKINSEVDDSVFEYIAPKGVAVIRP